MRDLDRMDAFETRLASLARAYTEPAAAPIDHLVTARTAMASATHGGVIGRLGLVGADGRRVWVLLLAAVLTAAALAVAVGNRLAPIVQPATGPGRIVFVRAGDLYVAEVDGSSQIRIAKGGANDARFGYLTALWAPDGRHIAATRDTGGATLTPAVDVLTADGTLVRTVDVGPGGTPSITWSPDGSEIAIAAYAANVPRDSGGPISSSLQLRVLGVDASADRDIELSPEWRGYASSDPEIWTVPDLGVRWSPDGRLIAVLAQIGWRVVAVDGSGPRRIEELIEGGGRIESFDWSTDGRRLAISGDWVGCALEVCLGIVETEGGRLTATVEHPARDPRMHRKLFWPEFSADGARVAVLGNLIDFAAEPSVTETWTLFDYDVATGRLTALTSGIRSMIVDVTGAAHPTGTEAGELVSGATVDWTPDGRRLLYLVREAGTSPATWAIHSVDPAAVNSSSVLVKGVQSFDIGPSD